MPTVWRVDRRISGAATLRFLTGLQKFCAVPADRLSATHRTAGTPVKIGTLPDGLVVGAIDATPDRKRFLALVPDRTGADSITVLAHWMSAIARR